MAREKSFGFLAFLLVFLCHLGPVAWGLMTDSQVLLKFKESLSNATALPDWNDQTTPCAKDDGTTNWGGVVCAKGSIKGLRLENMGLAGRIDVETLKNLPDLRTLSFMKNSFKGPLPDLKQIGGLRSLYLSDNQFSGVIPVDAFKGMSKLKKVYLAYNHFTGAIPSSLVTITMLVELRLEGNRFSGRVPEFSQSFHSFNVSNNTLEGPIPTSLSKIEPTSFSGNDGLCGAPLEECNNTTNKSESDAPSNVVPYKPSGLASTVIVAIVVVIAVPAILGAVVLITRLRKRLPLESIETPQQSLEHRARTGFRESERGSCRSLDHSGSTTKTDIIKLSFLMDDRERFDLPELLKASAEMLGCGCLGSSYKAGLSCGSVIVVKRFKQMNNVDKEEFQEHMRRLGRLRHPNLHPFLAYYYKKEEKLLITDFVKKGSLADHLHRNQALGHPQLDWPTRLKIIKGVAQGLTYLYKELPGIIAAHGHLKSSNILLYESNKPVLADYGLIPVINQENAQEVMVAYKSPEYLHLGRITKKTDVWSLGMLILELLTGKFPKNFLHKGKGNDEEDLANWVNSIPLEEWTDLVIDKAMKSDGGSGGEGESEIIKLLKIALNCCDMDVEKRLDLKEALERINEIKENDNDDDFHSSYASEADVRSSRGMSDDFNFA